MKKVNRVNMVDVYKCEYGTLKPVEVPWEGDWSTKANNGGMNQFGV
jgi:hypothetical protein